MLPHFKRELPVIFIRPKFYGPFFWMTASKYCNTIAPIQCSYTLAIPGDMTGTTQSATTRSAFLPSKSEYEGYQQCLGCTKQITLFFNFITLNGKETNIASKI